MGECLITRRGGSSIKYYILTVHTSPDALVTITNNKKTYTQTADSTGNVIFGKIAEGTWDIIATRDELRTERTVYVKGNELIEIILNTIPEFTFEVSPGVKGNYAIYDHLDNDITENPETNGNWKIKFFESGYLVFQCLNGAEYGIDVFCVGGGGGGSNGGGSDQGAGGGGGGGKTVTETVSVAKDTRYEIIIGSGDNPKGFFNAASQAGMTSAFGVTAEGGYTANGVAGGNGGSGGSSAYSGAGGTDGEDGASHGENFPAGKGQGTSTKEFGETDGELYASGGAGGTFGGNTSGASAAPNTGNGGNGGDANGLGGTGGSGIVIIRNHR